MCDGFKIFGTSSARVDFEGPEPVLTIRGRDLVNELRMLLERADSREFYRTGERLRVASAIVPAARALVDLHQLTAPVPQSEPVRDKAQVGRASWITTAEAATAIGVTERAIRKRITAGTLPATKRSGVWLINTKGLTDAAA